MFGVPQCQRYVAGAGGQYGHDQGVAEQQRVGPGLGPLEYRRDQGQGFLGPATRHPIAVKGHGEAQDLLGPARNAGGIPRRALQVHLIGVQPSEPVALVGSPQVRGRRLGDGQVMLAVGRRGGGLVLARLGETFGGELADRLQQPVAEGAPGGSATTRLLSTSEPSSSATSNTAMSPKPQTASAASRSNPSANTDRRRSSDCSAPLSSE